MTSINPPIRALMSVTVCTRLSFGKRANAIG